MILPTALYFLTGQFLAGLHLARAGAILNVTPGLYAKTAVRFDYGSYNEIISAIEVGVTGEYYSQKIPILLRNPQKAIFL